MHTHTYTRTHTPNDQLISPVPNFHSWMFKISCHLLGGSCIKAPTVFSGVAYKFSELFLEKMGGKMEFVRGKGTVLHLRWSRGTLTGGRISLPPKKENIVTVVCSNPVGLVTTSPLTRMVWSKPRMPMCRMRIRLTSTTPGTLSIRGEGRQTKKKNAETI